MELLRTLSCERPRDVGCFVSQPTSGWRPLIICYSCCQTVKHSHGRCVLIPGHDWSVHVKRTLYVPSHATIHLSREYLQHAKACLDGLQNYFFEKRESSLLPMWFIIRYNGVMRDFKYMFLMYSDFSVTFSVEFLEWDDHSTLSSWNKKKILFQFEMWEPKYIPRELWRTNPRNSSLAVASQGRCLDWHNQQQLIGRVIFNIVATVAVNC